MNNSQAGIEQLAGRRASPSSGLTWRLLMFSLTVFGVMILSYVGMQFGYLKLLENEKIKVDEEARVLISQVSEEEQESIADFYSRLFNMKGLLASHVYTSKFLNTIEKTTDQGVYLTKLSLDMEKQVVDMAGMARSYADLARQLEALKGMTGFSQLELKTAVLGGDGRVAWSADFKVNKTSLLK